MRSSIVRHSALEFLAFAAIALLLGTVPSQAQEYPSRRVKLVVAFSPGGTTDLVARVLARKLTEYFAQSVFVENRPGGGGNIGTDHVAKSAPDGYTLLLSAPAPITINISLYARMPYDPQRDFSPITLIATTPSLLLVHPSVPATSVRQLITLAKARPKQLNYASTGIGAPSHLMAELFNNAAGTHMVHIPYKGTGPALTDLLGGHVDVMFNTIPAILPYVRSGRLRALSITGARRLPLLPDLPTISESGLPGFESGGWYGLFAPAGTPKEVVDKLHSQVIRALRTTEVEQSLSNEGASLIGNTPAEFSVFLREDRTKWANVIRVSGARAE